VKYSFLTLALLFLLVGCCLSRPSADEMRAKVTLVRQGMREDEVRKLLGPIKLSLRSLNFGSKTYFYDLGPKISPDYTLVVTFIYTDGEWFLHSADVQKNDWEPWPPDHTIGAIFLYGVMSTLVLGLAIWYWRCTICGGGIKLDRKTGSKRWRVF